MARVLIDIRQPERKELTRDTVTQVRNRVTAPQVIEKKEIALQNNDITPSQDMTKFGKTIVGKILKGAAIAGGSILGLGAVSGVIKGVGAITGAKSIISGAGSAVDKVAQSAANLITGTTKDERDQVKEVKAEAKEASDKLEQVNRLIKAGATPERARAMAGVTEPELQTINGKEITSAGIGDFFANNKNILMIAGGVIAAFLFLPRIMKKR